MVNEIFRNYLNGLITKFSLNEEFGLNHKELGVFLREVLTKFNSCYPNKIIKKEIEIISGWKGKGSFEIDFFTDEIIIAEKSKDKETGEVSTIKHSVAPENVNRLLLFINQWEIGETRKCYDFATVLGELNWQEVWKKRSSVYFPRYYYPIKVLEAMKKIKYSGRGDITRLI